MCFLRNVELVNNPCARAVLIWTGQYSKTEKEDTSTQALLFKSKNEENSLVL